MAVLLITLKVAFLSYKMGKLFFDVYNICEGKTKNWTSHKNDNDCGYEFLN